MTPTKQHARLLIGLLVAASVLVDLVVLRVFSATLAWHLSPAALGLLALAFSQMSLLAVWMVMGGGAVWLRWIGTILGAAFWSVMLPFGTRYHEFNPFFAISTTSVLVSQMGVAAAASLVLRVTGGQLMAVWQPNAVRSTADGHRQFQFSIRQMLGWTTALAITLATLRMPYLRLLAQTLRASFDLGHLLMQIGFATVTLAALWTALGTRRLGLRLATLCLTTVATTVGWMGLEGRDWTTAQFSLFHVVLLIASLAVVRMAGYRLVWRAAGRSESHGQ